MDIVWTVRAERHLVSIAAYIARDSPDAARRTVDRIRDAVAHLSAFPTMGRVGRVDGTRELVVASTPYIVAYRVRRNSLRILVVLHAARQWPDKL